VQATDLAVWVSRVTIFSAAMERVGARSKSARMKRWIVIFSLFGARVLWLKSRD
jgi:hypothetical protein